jgi:purine-binding chemotaxis protein CheW
VFDFKGLPPELRRQTTRHEDQQADTRRQVLTFHMGDEVFGVDVEQVREIITVPEIHQRVLVEDYILGVISLRGERLSIVDLKMLVGEGTSVLTPERRIIILRDESLRMGVLVDGIKEVSCFLAKELEPMPPLVGTRHSKGFSGVIERSDGAVVLLDMGELFSTFRERIAGHLRINDDNDDAEESTVFGPTMIIDVTRFMAAVAASNQQDPVSSETAFSALSDEGPISSPKPAMQA